MIVTQLPPYQIHLDPAYPPELGELTRALDAIGLQFEQYAVQSGLAVKAKDAKLLVSSVSLGSIDLALVPDLIAIAGLLAPTVPVEQVKNFVEYIKLLINVFEHEKKPVEQVSIRDCEDVAAIMAPIANHGGQQTINVHNGDIYQPIIVIDQERARALTSTAMTTKALIQSPNAEIKQRVPMIWKGLYNDEPRTSGARSPDKALIEENRSKRETCIL